MEAVIIVLPVVAAVVIGAWIIAQALRPKGAVGPDADVLRLGEQLAAAKTDLTQAVASSQQALLGQVNAVDAKLNQRLDAVGTSVGQRLDAVQSSVSHSLTSNTEEMSRIGHQLGELKQSTQQMLDIGRDIASLQDILRPPKVRGGFGELLLERLLAEILPEQNFSTQYRFRSGLIVDAAVHLGSAVVPVDSKFPLEAFNRMMKAESDEERASMRREFVRAVRGHIDAVAKYILPDEGSLPFALMYIPAENVYYEVIVKDDLGEGQVNLCAYAMERRVIPVSPSSFYAYLQAILIGLKGMQVEAHAQEIIRHVERLSGDFSRVRKDFSTLGSHLKNASDRYSDIDRAVNKFGDRLQLTLNEPLQAPLPQADIAPAPLGLPSITNGLDEL